MGKPRSPHRELCGKQKHSCRRGETSHHCHPGSAPRHRDGNYIDRLSGSQAVSPNPGSRDEHSGQALNVESRRHWANGQTMIPLSRRSEATSAYQATRKRTPEPPTRATYTDSWSNAHSKGGWGPSRLQSRKEGSTTIPMPCPLSVCIPGSQPTRAPALIGQAHQQSRLSKMTPL